MSLYLSQQKTALTFDDILLQPQVSSISSRKDIDLSQNFSKYKLKLPFMSANMSSVTEEKMAEEMNSLGCLPSIHRYMSKERQLSFYRKQSKEKHPFIIPLGLGEDYRNLVIELAEEFSNEPIYLVDVAHGGMKAVGELVKWIKQNAYMPFVIAGNVCNYETALYLSQSGADAVKCGVGAGAACITRSVAGCGNPSLTAIMDCARIKEQYPNVKLIADGGIRKPADCVKALAAGADLVMIGSLFAGCDESPGELIEMDGRKFKDYWGMASSKQMKLIGKKNTTAEGIEGLIPYKGPVSKVVSELEGGLRSGFSYLGVQNIKELHEAQIGYVKISHNGFIENGTI